MPKSQQQPMRPPTPFERLADPEGRRRSADPKLTANGSVRAGRAAQFMPFAALTDTTSSYVSRKSPSNPNANSRKKKPSSFRKSSRASNAATWSASPITIRTAIAPAPASSTKCYPHSSCSNSGISPSTSTISKASSCVVEPSNENACARREQCQALRQLQPAIPRPA